MRLSVVVGRLALLLLWCFTTSAAESLAQTSLCAAGDFHNTAGSTLIDAGSPSVVQAYSGAETVAAMADNNVQRIVIMANVDFSTANWGAYALPVVITRNVTFSGAFADDKRWPVVNMAYVRAAFRLGPRVVFCLSQVVLRGLREGPIWQAPGLDLLALPSSDTSLGLGMSAEAAAAISNGMADVPVAVVTNGALIYRACLPPSWGAMSINSIPRPPRFPGNQSEWLLPTKVDGTCDNTTTDPLRKGMDYCWPGWGFDADLALYGSDVDTFDKPILRDYAIYMKSVYYLCEIVMPDDCTKEYTPVGCFRRLVPKAPSGAPAPVRADLPSASSLQQSLDTDEALSIGGTKSDDSSGAGGGDGGTNAGLVMAGAIGGAVVGVALLAAALALLLLRRRRRLKCSSNAEHRSSNQLAAADTCSESHTSQHLPDPSPSDLRVELGEDKTAAEDLFATQDGNVPRKLAAPVTSLMQPADGILPQLGTLSSSPFSDFRTSPLRFTADELALVPITENTPMEASLDLSVKLRSSRPGISRLAKRTSCGMVPEVADECGAVMKDIKGSSDGGGGGGKASNSAIDNPVFGELNEADASADGNAAADGEAEATGFGPEVTLLPTVLGAGAFGKVMVGMYQGSRVAVKMLKRDLLPLGDSNKSSGCVAQDEAATESEIVKAQERTFEYERKALEQEVAVLARCRHPNIVRLLAASLDAARVCLVMELMDTSLERLLYNHYKGDMPLPLVLHIGTQIARALAYLHPTILHRDLKPANVLISQPYSDKPIAKLADFGFSRLLSSVLVTRHPVTGTAPYMAPETFNIMTQDITDRTDIYSLGVILFELLSGSRPWDGLGMLQIASALIIRGAKLPLHFVSENRCPNKLRVLIRSCWDTDPFRRPAAAEVVKALALVQEELGCL